MKTGAGEDEFSQSCGVCRLFPNFRKTGVGKSESSQVLELVNYSWTIEKITGYLIAHVFFSCYQWKTFNNSIYNSLKYSWYNIFSRIFDPFLSKYKAHAQNSEQLKFLYRSDNYLCLLRAYGHEAEGKLFKWPNNFTNYYYEYYYTYSTRSFVTLEHVHDTHGLERKTQSRFVRQRRTPVNESGK